MPYQIGMPPATAGKTGGKVYAPGKFNIGEDATALGLKDYQEGTTYTLNPDSEMEQLTTTTDKKYGTTKVG